MLHEYGFGEDAGIVYVITFVAGNYGSGAEMKYICLSLLVASSAFAQGPSQPTPASVQTLPAAVEVPAPEPDYASWTNEALIAKLPPGKREVQWDPSGGRWLRDPVSIEWGDRVAHGAFTSEEFGAAVRKSRLLRSSPTAYLGEDYHVSLRPPAWLPNHSIRAALKHTEGQVARSLFSADSYCGTSMVEGAAEDKFQNVGTLPGWATSADFEVEIWNSAKYYDQKLVWKGDVSLPVRQIAHAHPTSVDTPELAAEIRTLSHIAAVSGRYESGASISFSTSLQRPLEGPLADTYVCLKVDLLRDGVVVLTRDVEDPDEVTDPWAEYHWEPDEQGNANAFPDEVNAIIGRKGVERYTVRVRGVYPEKLMRWPRAHYWSGQYTVPLAEALQSIETRSE